MVTLVKDKTPDPEWLAEADELYRAIGEFIVVFSTVVMEMRRFLQQTITPKGTREYRLMNAVFDQMNAIAIKKAFFSTCSQLRQLNSEDVKVRKVLDKNISGLMTERNQIAHADWHVRDYLRKPRSGALAVKIKVTNETLDIVTLDLSVERLKKLSEEASRIRRQIVIFGRSCTWEQNPSPSDIYEIKDDEDRRKYLLRKDGYPEGGIQIGE
jgi:hypothetical protein